MLVHTLCLALSLAGSHAPYAAPFKIVPVKKLDQIRIVSVAAAPTGTRFACGLENGVIRVFDAKTQKTVLTLTGHPQAAYGLAFSPDGKLLASGDETARIYVWNLKSGKKVCEYPRAKGHIRGIQALAFTRDGKSIVSVGKDDTMRVWKLSGGNPTATILGKGANFYGIGIGPSGSIVTGTLKEGARLYAPKTYSPVASMTLKGGQGALDAAMNKAGTRIATGGKDGAVTIWDAKSRKSLGAATKHGDWVMRVTFSPNGRLVASSSNDMTVQVWDTVSKTVVAKLESQSPIGSPLAFTGDGAFLISATSGDSLQINSVSPPQGGAGGRKR